MVLRRHAFSTEFLFILCRICLRKKLENALPKMRVGTSHFFAPFFGEKRSKISPVRSRVRSGLFLGKISGKFWPLSGENSWHCHLRVGEWIQEADSSGFVK